MSSEEELETKKVRESKEKKEPKKKGSDVKDAKQQKKSKIELPEGWTTEKDQPVVKLNDDTRVAISVFKGTKYVDIRKMFKEAPTKKGISLNATLWKELMKHHEEISSLLEN